MTDFLAFYNSAVALSNGKYVSLYPLPMVYLFELFIYLPPLVGYLLLTFISILLLVIIFKRQSLLWVFYVPFLQMLWTGQLDIIFYFLYTRKTFWSFALLTLKPQLFLFALPDLWSKLRNRDYKFLLKFGSLTTLIYLPFFIIRPMWVIEWLRQMDDGRLSHNNSASFWALPVLLTFCLILIPLLKKSPKVLISSFNPAFRPYDYVFLMGESKIIIILSWILLLIVNYYQVDWIWAFLGIGTLVPLFFDRILKYNHKQSSNSVVRISL